MSPKEVLLKVSQRGCLPNRNCWMLLKDGLLNVHQKHVWYVIQKVHVRYHFKSSILLRNKPIVIATEFSEYHMQKIIIQF